MNYKITFLYNDNKYREIVATKKDKEKLITDLMNNQNLRFYRINYNDGEVFINVYNLLDIIVMPEEKND